MCMPLVSEYQLKLLLDMDQYRSVKPKFFVRDALAGRTPF